MRSVQFRTASPAGSKDQLGIAGCEPLPVGGGGGGKKDGGEEAWIEHGPHLSARCGGDQ
jgi:hypothetical protein